MCFLYFILDPELIFDRMKLHEDGLQDVIDVFPRDFNIKQFKPDMSGIFASIDSKCKKQARTANMHQKITQRSNFQNEKVLEKLSQCKNLMKFMWQ